MVIEICDNYAIFRRKICDSNVLVRRKSMIVMLYSAKKAGLFAEGVED